MMKHCQRRNMSRVSEKLISFLPAYVHVRQSFFIIGFHLIKYAWVRGMQILVDREVECSILQLHST